MIAAVFLRQLKIRILHASAISSPSPRKHVNIPRRGKQEYKNTKKINIYYIRKPRGAGHNRTQREEGIKEDERSRGSSKDECEKYTTNKTEKIECIRKIRRRSGGDAQRGKQTGVGR